MQPRVRAPELPQDRTWLNTDYALSLKDLKGRVVILDFWTYCCINCLHVLPDLKYLENKYKGGLTVIGIHSAKFDNEKEAENIRQAVLRYDIEHPVLVDSNFHVWEQYAVRAWPTLMVIDPEGYVIASVSGEGNRDVLDQLISQLLRKHQEKGTTHFQALSFTLEKQHQPLATPLAFPGKVLVDEVSLSKAAPKQPCLFIADSGHHRIVVSTLAGEVQYVIGTGKPGLTDGSFSEAQFFAPQGMALDHESQILYIADSEVSSIRAVGLVNNLAVQTVCGSGELFGFGDVDADGFDARLQHCLGVEYAQNYLWVADTYNHKIKRVDPHTGNCQTLLGNGKSGHQDGLGNEVRFSEPSGLSAIMSHLYIADTNNHAIRCVDLNTLQVKTLAFPGLCAPDVCLPTTTHS